MKNHEFDFLDSHSPSVIQEMYKRYQENPDAVPDSWSHFFQGFDFALSGAEGGNIERPDRSASCQIDKEFAVHELIQAYRQRGHLFTATNPVRKRRNYSPPLKIEEFALSDTDWDVPFLAGELIGIGKSSLRNIVAHLEATYCKSVGVEYLYIRDPEVVKWLQQEMENSKNRRAFSDKEKEQIVDTLIQATGFEQFVHARFTGQKRFSLEGAEVLIPGLNALVQQAAVEGVKECVVGMAHRGRLNVLTHVFQKPVRDIFKEFEGAAYEKGISLGDVKYHLGYGRDCNTSDGNTVRINLVPNPSHLEAVLPVVQGLSRAKIEDKHDNNFHQLVPIVIHGDAAIAGQGVVYETVQMSQLEGYKTGGTIHVVVNNQVGFTTDYLEARSSTYCTDIAKVNRCPVFHVNGDDPEAVIYTMELALRFRQRYHTDVFIDILCYRRHGHNEGDEPRFTQPELYKAIALHDNCRDIYAKKLVASGVLSQKVVDEKQAHCWEYLDEELLEARKSKVLSIRTFLPQTWEQFRHAEAKDFMEEPQTAIALSRVMQLTEALNTLPEGIPFYKKVNRIIGERKKMFDVGEMDWAMAELLAYASLLEDGHPVRLSGQDAVRGTFGHRHAAFTIDNSSERYGLLEHLPQRKADVGIYNSPLSEYGVMGFDYGYALGCPQGLTLWEGQFGDFYNVAQVIVDQYLASAEEKWGVMNGLVLLLPHGFEGQGPEHSSARIERFLSLAARNNMQICNCSTPANFFHLLRRQVARDFRVPLIVFTPKSLLRHPACRSKLSEFSERTFQPVIDDEVVEVDNVRRVVFCSGKIYYDLLKKKNELEATDIALVRLEQLHPFPVQHIQRILKKYGHAMLYLWVQEEPLNMGAWSYLTRVWKPEDFGEVKLLAVARQEAGSPATGLKVLHERGQEEIIAKVFKPCTCSKKLKYCTLQCVEGRTRQEILKQHYYFKDPSIFSV